MSPSAAGLLQLAVTSRTTRSSNESNKLRNGNSKQCKHVHPQNLQKIQVTPVGRKSRIIHTLQSKPIQFIQLPFVQNNPTFHNDCVLFRGELSLKGSSLTVHTFGNRIYIFPVPFLSPLPY